MRDGLASCGQQPDAAGDPGPGRSALRQPCVEKDRVWFDLTTFPEYQVAIGQSEINNGTHVPSGDSQSKRQHTLTK